jgi:hypothetical protein
MAEDGPVEVGGQHQLVALGQQMAQRAECWLMVPVHRPGHVFRSHAHADAEAQCTAVQCRLTLQAGSGPEERDGF